VSTPKADFPESVSPDFKQDATGGGKMPKIKVPWINGKRLMERWNMNLDGLYQAIFYLHLPVYNRYHEKLDRKGTKFIFGNPLDDLCELTLHPTWPDI
jgi:hypothetical protein